MSPVTSTVTKLFSKIKIPLQELVAHACNPSYSGGRDHEDPASLANSLWDPILKKPITKKGCGVAQSVGPELKPQQKKKKN
jgi:hypothetical protein